MTRKGWCSLMAVLAGAAAAGSCKGGGGQRAASPQEIEELRTQLQATQDSLDDFKAKVKKYFKHDGPDVTSPRSFYMYVDSLALLACDLRSRAANPKPPGYSICPDPIRAEKTPPPTYPPR